MHDVVFFYTENRDHAWYSEFTVSRTIGLGFVFALHDYATYLKFRLGPISFTFGHRSRAAH